MNKESKKMYDKIRSYLTVYMPKQRGLSQHTITSYRQTINQFLLFVTETRKIQYGEICFQDWSAYMINKYLIYLEQERLVSAATRNQRLFAIRAFLKYARISNPELISLSMEAGGIALAKEPKEPVAFLSETAIEVLLRSPSYGDIQSRFHITSVIFTFLQELRIHRNHQMLLHLFRKVFEAGCPYTAEPVIIIRLCDAVAGTPVGYTHANRTVLAFPDLCCPFPETVLCGNHRCF